jgi:hypothetical protein
MSTQREELVVLQNSSLQGLHSPGVIRHEGFIIETAHVVFNQTKKLQTYRYDVIQI